MLRVEGGGEILSAIIEWLSSESDQAEDDGWVGIQYVWGPHT